MLPQTDYTGVLLLAHTIASLMCQAALQAFGGR